MDLLYFLTKKAGEYNFVNDTTLLQKRRINRTLGRMTPLERSQYLIHIINKSEKGILAFHNKQIESKWTKGDVFKHFNCLNNKDIYNTSQFSAGRLHVIRKCTHSLNIYKLWWDTAKNYPKLFDDSKSIISNFPNFIENRHDASCWSLICKTYVVEEDIDWDSVPIKATRLPDRDLVCTQ